LISNIDYDFFTVISSGFQPTHGYYVILEKVKAAKKQPIQARYSNMVAISTPAETRTLLENITPQFHCEGS
jgi:hypothetical protein